MASNNKLSAQEQQDLLKTLHQRFEKNQTRHKGITWAEVEKKLTTQPKKLWSLFQMENSEGEPDVIGKDKKSGDFIFMDCCAESPKGRRSICYDHEALAARKEHKPKDSAINMASEMGVEILNEDDYRHLQSFGNFDTKTSTWLETSKAIRALGGAIFGDKRYDHIFIYHNGAESYYAARGFRAKLLV